MKNIKVLKKHAQEILDHVSPVSDDAAIDATGQESGFIDYNFDILRQYYAGTDFENEANTICDLLTTFTMKNKGSSNLPVVINSIRMGLKREDGQLYPEFEPYEDFISRLMSVMEAVAVNKSNITAGMDPVPIQTEQQQTNEDMKELPNINEAQAKLMELEQYVRGMNLDQRQKWKDYLAEARKLAAVGDDSFNAMPELDPEDMAYLKESERQKMTRGSQKQAMLQQLVGVNQQLPGV